MEEILNTDDSDFTDLYVTQNSQNRRMKQEQSQIYLGSALQRGGRAQLNSRNFWRLFSRAGTEEAAKAKPNLFELCWVATEEERSSNLTKILFKNLRKKPKKPFHRFGSVGALRMLPSMPAVNLFPSFIASLIRGISCPKIDKRKTEKT